MQADQAARKQWALARLEDIPDDHPAGWWDQEASTEGFGTRWHPVRRHFGIEGFGIAASGADAGQELVVPHNELGEGEVETVEDPYVRGQEEVYFLARGRARFVLDDEEAELTAGDILFVPPHVQRAATALEDDTLVLGVGGAPGKPYQGLDPSKHLPDASPDSVAARRSGGDEQPA